MTMSLLRHNNVGLTTEAAPEEMSRKTGSDCADEKLRQTVQDTGRSNRESSVTDGW